MTETNHTADHDLEDRTFRFAQAVRAFVRGLPKSLQNTEATSDFLCHHPERELSKFRELVFWSLELA